MSNYLTKEMLAPAAPRTFAARSGGLISRLMFGAKHHWQRRKMTIALQGLDDRLLTDIGLQRGDIPRLVAGLSPRELGMAPVAPTYRGATPQEGNTYLHAA